MWHLLDGSICLKTKKYYLSYSSYACMCVLAKSFQLCLTLGDPVDCILSITMSGMFTLEFLFYNAIISCFVPLSGEILCLFIYSLK